MNVSKKIGLLSVAGAMAFSFSLFGCGNNITVEPPEEKVTEERGNQAAAEVDYKSYTGGTAALFVENQSKEKLIAFKGDLDKDYIIGGIPGSAKNHGLKRTKDLEGTGDFALVLITEDEYKKNINDLKKAVKFATLYAFYNDKISANTIFKISANSGGSGRILLPNMSNWNIELRENGPEGEVLGYVSAQTTNTVMRVEAPGDYTLFPVFKKFTNSALTGPEIYEAVPKFKSGSLNGKPYFRDLTLENKDSEIRWDLGDLANQVEMNLSSGGVFITIQNNNRGTSVRFMRGDEELMTSMGVKGIPPSKSSLFSLKVPRNPDNTYPKNFSFGGLKIATSAGALDIPETRYDLDYVYTIYASGEDLSNLSLMTARQMIASLPLSEQGRYNLAHFRDDYAEIYFVNNEDRTEAELATSEAAYNIWLDKVLVEKGQKLNLNQIFGM